MSHFLIPIDLIKCLHTIVVYFRSTCSYYEQDEDIEHYGASVGDDFYAK